MQEPLGVTYVVPEGHEPVPVYEAEGGIPIEERDGPYVISDGLSLEDPVPIVDAGGPTWAASDGSLQDALPVTGIAPPLPDPQPFTLFTGASVESGDIGYYRTVYGDISSEPLDDFPLLEFATRNAGYFQIAFVGDCLNIMAGRFPTVPGVTIGDVISDWAFDGSNTSATWEDGGSMADNQEYEVTWP